MFMNITSSLTMIVSLQRKELMTANVWFTLQRSAKFVIAERFCCLFYLLSRIKHLLYST